jgi:hypothetical protein
MVEFPFLWAREIAERFRLAPEYVAARTVLIRLAVTQ